MRYVILINSKAVKVTNNEYGPYFSVESVCRDNKMNVDSHSMLIRTFILENIINSLNLLPPSHNQ